VGVANVGISGNKLLLNGAGRMHWRGLTATR
jgi:hypothetical protein